MSIRISAHRFAFEVQLSRAIAVGIILLCWQHHAYLDACVRWFYCDILIHSWIFRHESFEPVLSTVTFFFVMMSWYLIDFHCIWLHKYRFSRSDNLSAWNGRQSAFFKETVWYIAPWLVIDCFWKRRHLPVDPPTFFQVVSQILLALLAFDFFFFIGHVTLHYFPQLYQKIHAEHHNSAVTRATDTIRHTFLDGSWDVACSVMALNFTRAHPLSRSLYNIVSIILITEQHCGMNFPWMLHNMLPGNFIAGPTIHDLHHRNGKVNFQKYFTYLDWIFGTLKLN